MIAVPVALPVTIPEVLMVATDVLELDQEPPEVESANVVTLPAHKLLAPVILPTVIVGQFTVTTKDVIVLPHALPTV